MKDVQKDNIENNGLKSTRKLRMQKYDEKIENLLKEVLEEFVFNNLDDARGDVRNNAKWVYTGCLTEK